MRLTVTLVFDRTIQDVQKLKELIAKKASWTEEDWSIWNSGKGAYNASDLNRVGVACTEIAAALGVSIQPKINWTMNDTPTKSQMDTYLENVRKLAQKANVDYSSLPQSMDNLTIDGANAIEKILYNISIK